MINKELILKKVSKLEDKLLTSKVLDKAYQSEKTHKVTYSDFLDPYQRSIIEKAISDIGGIEYNFSGGYIGAERVIIFFCPNFASEDYDDIEVPFKVLNIKHNTRDSLIHRDYLGALMGLGIKREKIGDILVRDNVCSIIVLKEIAEYISYNLSKVGNIKVEIEFGEIEQLEILEPKVREIRGTVASPRLDSLASLGYGISRSKIADFIRSEKVSVNWEITSSLTKLIKEGNVISIRGKGRIEVVKLGGLTKKGRLSVVLKKYI